MFVDAALLVGFLTEFITREGPDYGLHSWVGITLVPIIAIHLLGNLGWIRRVVSRGRQDREFSLAMVITQHRPPIRSSWLTNIGDKEGLAQDLCRVGAHPAAIGP